jgi:uncharacterized protein
LPRLFVKTIPVFQLSFISHIIMRCTVSQTRPSSPCLKICVMDSASRICEGCGRTIEEISGWIRLSEPERIAIMAILPARLAQLHDEQSSGS